MSPFKDFQDSFAGAIKNRVDGEREVIVESRRPSAAKERPGFGACLRVLQCRGWDRLLELIERRQPHPRLLSICERLDLGPKNSLTLVACQGRRFLIAIGGDAVSAMVEILPTTEYAAAMTAAATTLGATTHDRIPILRPALWSAQ